MILLPYGYAIDADTYQFILGKPATITNKQTGNESIVLQNSSYHPSVESALNSFIRLIQCNAISSKDMSMKEAVQACKSAVNEFKELLIKDDILETIVINNVTVKGGFESSQEDNEDDD
jgi:hypothetical protein